MAKILMQRQCSNGDACRAILFAHFRLSALTEKKFKAKSIKIASHGTADGRMNGWMDAWMDR